MNKSEECFVAFVDLLGFTKFVENESPECVYRILENFTTSPKMMKQIEINYNVFSDTIVISTPTLRDSESQAKVNVNFDMFLYIISLMQMNNIVKNNGLPVRGGITNGEFFTNGANLFFGKGYLAALEIEAKLAVYPRIIIDENIINDMNINSRINSYVFKIGDPRFHIRKDFDGLFHLNYLSVAHTVKSESIDACIIQRHKDYILNNLNITQQSSAKSKYNWLKTYHNWFCDGFDELRQLKIDAEVNQ